MLAYFDRRKMSAAVEGLNNKARVITRRRNSLKSADSRWQLGLPVAASLPSSGLDIKIPSAATKRGEGIV